MRLTERDLQVLKDITLSHALSRDQILELGYFTSITRANTRLREMRESGLVRRLDTPFFAQSLYAVGTKATELLGPRIGAIVAARSGSPRFLQHALMVTNVRIALAQRGASDWRFEQQLRTSFAVGKRLIEVRPDGLAYLSSGPTVIEVDLGHVSRAKFAAKLTCYEAFITSGEAARLWKLKSFKVLTLTTGKSRAAHLTRLKPVNAHYEFLCTTFDELGVRLVGAWS